MHDKWMLSQYGGKLSDFLKNLMNLLKRDMYA